MNPSFKELNLLHYTGFLAAAVSAGIHFYLAPQIGLNLLGLSFVIAGLGFTAGITAVTLDYKRKTVYLLGLPFTLGQIIIWYYMNSVPLESLLRGEPLLDFIDKLAQTLLIIILVILYAKS